jgi:hypothetical protein
MEPICDFFDQYSKFPASYKTPQLDKVISAIHYILFLDNIEIEHNAIPNIKSIYKLKCRKKKRNQLKLYVIDFLNHVIRRSTASLVLYNVPTHFKDSGEEVSPQDIEDTITNFINASAIRQLLRINDTTYLLYIDNEPDIVELKRVFDGNFTEGNLLKCKIVKNHKKANHLQYTIQPQTELQKSIVRSTCPIDWILNNYRLIYAEVFMICLVFLYYI